MRHPYRDPIVRLRVGPDIAPDEAAMPPRPRGSRRPHTDGKVALVRRLIEQTTLTYGEIAQRTGVGRASICRWTNDQGWKRPLFAPRATDTIPRARASMRLKQRTLAARLTALAERHIAELEAANCVDPDKLGQALDLYKMARLAAMGRHRRRKPPAMELRDATGGPMRPVIELIAAEVDMRRVPKAALDDYLKHRAPREQDLPPKWKYTKGFAREERHRRMKERE